MLATRAFTENGLYLNLGYWKTARTIDEACAALAMLVAEAAGMGLDDEVVDVGSALPTRTCCGWSASPRHITGLNVTPMQVRLVRQRVQRRGMADRITLTEGSATAMPLCVERDWPSAAHEAFPAAATGRGAVSICHALSQDELYWRQLAGSLNSSTLTKSARLDSNTRVRREWMRGRDNINKRHLIHIAGYNLGLIMHLLTGAGTPREFQPKLSAWLAALMLPNGCPMLLLIVGGGDQTAALAVTFEPDPLS